MRKTITYVLLLIIGILNLSSTKAATFPKSTIPEGIGVVSWYDTKDMNIMQNIGVKLVRTDLIWSMCETQKGVYDFSYFDSVYNNYVSRGISVMFILDYSNPLYETNKSIQTDAGRAAFTNFAAAAARHFSGKGIIWEIWNEPNNPEFWQPQPDVNQYMALVKVTVPAIRKVDPSSVIIAPATSEIPLTFLEACFSQGLLQLVDAVSIHPYRLTSPPETFEVDLNNLRALIAKYNSGNPNFPVISSEWGYSSVGSGIDENTQGKYLSRMMLDNLSLGIPVSVWYSLKDTGITSNTWDHLGLVRSDYSQKPAYSALQTLLQQLKGMHFDKRLPSASCDYLLQFTDGTNTKIAAWTTISAHSVTALPGLNVNLTDSVTYMPVTVGQIPNAPSNLTFVSVAKGATSGNYYVNLTWKDNSNNETGFEIYQSINSTGNFKLIKTLAANSTGYLINIGSNPKHGTYYYTIYAVNQYGKSQPSNTVSAKI